MIFCRRAIQEIWKILFDCGGLENFLLSTLKYVRQISELNCHHHRHHIKCQLALCIKSLAGLLICSNVYLLAGSTIYSLNFLIAHWFAHSLDCSLSSLLTCLLAYSLVYHVYDCQKHILGIVCLLISCLFDCLLV